MTSAPAVLETTPSQKNTHPEFERGQALFNQVSLYLSSQNIGFKNIDMDTNNSACKRCISVANEAGKTIFISFDFARAAAFGRNYEFNVAVANTQGNPATIMGFDDKRLLMTTNRGVNGFEERFTRYMSEFTGRTLKTLSLSQ